MNVVSLFLGTEGRITRKQFWLGILAIFLIGTPIQLGAAFVGGPTAFAIVNLFFLWVGFALSAKRAQDRNRHYFIVAAYFAIAALVSSITTASTSMAMEMSQGQQAIVGVLSLAFLGYVVYLFVELGCLRGTVGPNKYGPDPLEPATPMPPPLPPLPNQAGYRPG
jgi:uncharacterized membrane protein YhaH (DUF805 family)